MSNYNFVVVGTQRTGTTVICQAINSHKSVRCYQELFNMGSLRNSPAKSKRAYHVYRKASLLNYAKHFLYRSKFISEYLDWVYHKSKKTIGFKLMANQGRDFPDAVDYLKNNKIKVIHVVRKNTLKVLVSRYAAKSRGAHSKVPVGETKVKLAAQSLLNDLKAIESDNDFWRDEFYGSNNYLLVEYEEYVLDRVAVQNKICDFLGLDKQVFIEKYIKMTSGELRQVVVNYDVIKSVLVGTKYEKYL